MEERKLRKLLVLENLCKVFCFAHAVCAMMLAMVIDFAPDWPAVLFAILYCTILASLFGTLSVEYRSRQEELLIKAWRRRLPW